MVLFYKTYQIFINPLVKNFKSIFLFITLISTAGVHKYYVSTTLIDKDQKDNYYKVTLKAFYDDIELELGLDDRVVNYQDEYSYLKELFNDYLKKNFILIADNNKINYDFLGFEKRNDVLQFYMQFSTDDKTKKLIISNKILYKSFDNQKNLILYRSKLTRKSFIQSRNKHTNQINF